LIWNIGYRMLNLWGNLLDGPVLGSSHVVWWIRLVSSRFPHRCRWQFFDFPNMKWIGGHYSSWSVWSLKRLQKNAQRLWLKKFYASMHCWLVERSLWWEIVLLWPVINFVSNWAYFRVWRLEMVTNSRQRLYVIKSQVAVVWRVSQCWFAEVVWWALLRSWDEWIIFDYWQSFEYWLNKWYSFTFLFDFKLIFERKLHSVLVFQIWVRESRFWAKSTKIFHFFPYFTPF
jgi:hypothetical protein